MNGIGGGWIMPNYSGIKSFYRNNYDWDDMQVSLSTAKLPAANSPTWRQHDYGISGGVEFDVLGFGIGDSITFKAQTSHAMKILSELCLHVHGTIPSDSVGDKIKWQVDIIAAGVFDTWAAVAGSPFTAEFTLTGEQADRHNIFEVACVPAVNTTVSSIYQFKLTRVSASSDDYGNEVYLDFADSHVLIDSNGSRQEFVK